MGGTPLPPFTDKIFGKKGVTDLGGTPPSPFTDKIRKVVFEVFPYRFVLFWRPSGKHKINIKRHFEGYDCHNFEVNFTFLPQIYALSC